MSLNNVFRTYGDLLKWHNKGHAIWEPLLADEIKVGSVGYFNSHGRWESLFDSVKDTPCTTNFAKDIKLVTTEAEKLREFPSEHLQVFTIDGSVALELIPIETTLADINSGAAIGIPGRMGVGLRWSKESQKAAFLCCRQLRTVRMKDETVAIKKWGKSNAKFILSQRPETKERGFCVVTAIHSAKSCQLSCWEKWSSFISGGGSGGPSGPPGNAVKVEGSSFASAIHSGWINREVSIYLNVVDNQSRKKEYVAFVEGLFFRVGRWGTTNVSEDVQKAIASLIRVAHLARRWPGGGRNRSRGPR
jgi:hypothetical protein